MCPKEVATPGIDVGLQVGGIPYLGFLLKSEKQTILVDAGISEKFIINGRAWGGFEAEGGRSFVKKALEEENVRIGDIDIVIYTHLHNDHTGACDLLRDVPKHIVQLDEWLQLLDPIPAAFIRRDYDQSVIPELQKANLLKIDGDVEVAEGVWVYKAPGHTSGSQIVAVKTAKGTVVLCGDNVLIYCNIFPWMDELTGLDGKKYKITPAPEIYKKGIPPGILYDYYSWYKTLDKIRALASKNSPEFIIPAHEPSIVGKTFG